VTIKGKDLTGALAVVIGGANATISSKSTASKLVATVTANAIPGPGFITVTSASGGTLTSKQFTVIKS
jgi:IPT/TIG domain